MSSPTGRPTWLNDLYQSINQSINQSLNQSINYSINQCRQKPSPIFLAYLTLQHLHACSAKLPKGKSPSYCQLQLTIPFSRPVFFVAILSNPLSPTPSWTD